MILNIPNITDLPYYKVKEEKIKKKHFPLVRLLVVYASFKFRWIFTLAKLS